MSMRAYKCIIFILTVMLVWVACKYLALSSKIMTAAFISNQASTLRNDIRYASSGSAVSGSVGTLIGRDQILTDLNWYLNYYDHRTNELAGSKVLFFVRLEREYLVRDAITYLRQNSTNDFGDDPYVWLAHEMAH